MKHTLNKVSTWLNQHGYGSVVDSKSVSGGSICDAVTITTDKGYHFFVKTLRQYVERLFLAEAHSLNTLKNNSPLRVPQVFSVTPDYLVLEYIEPHKPDEGYWLTLGRGLATQHLNYGPHFGFDEDNFIGRTPQPNLATQCGYDFFTEQRLLFQVRLAMDNGHLNPATVTQVEFLCGKLKELIPRQPPSVLHGDLWAGNIHTDKTGQPVLIDPAVYWGWAEADLGMTQLFGGFPKSFYDAYQEIRPLDSNWQKRLEIYNLYHLLNHLNLFGSSYHAQVVNLIKRYS